MRLLPHLVQYMAETVVTHLAREGYAEIGSPRRLAEVVANILDGEMEREAALEEEAHDLLSRHYEQVRAEGAEYHELFKRVRDRLAGDRGFILSGGDGRSKLSDDKVTNLSHVIADALAADESVEFLEAYNGVRGAVRSSIAGVLRKDLQIIAAVEDKIRSLKRRVPQGSQEWDALFRKYYREEIEKLRSIR